MSDTPGMAGRLFKALGDKNINIRMIAQSSDEINITIAVSRKDLARTIQAIYHEFVTKEDAFHE